MWGGRQPRILVDNFWIPRSKTRTCSTPGFHADTAVPRYYFFRINTSLCLFCFQGQNNFISLVDIHVQHLASLCRICGDRIKDHKRKVYTTAPTLFLRFTTSGKIYYCWILQMFIHSWKKIKRKTAIFNCIKRRISLLIEHALIIWDKIKTLQVRQQAKKAPDGWSQHETTQKNKQEKLINLNYFLFLLWWLVLWFLSCRS